MSLEIFTLGMLFPILNILANVGIENIQYIPIFILEYKKEDLIIVFLVIFVLIYLFKILMTTLIHWLALSYHLDLQVYLSNRLFEKYLFQNFTFHLNRNSSELVRNLKDNVVEFSTHGIGSLLILLTELFVVIGILSFLLYVQTITTLFIFSTLIIIFILFNIYVSPTSFNLGKSSLDHGKLYIQHLYQGLHSIKEIKILNRQQSFLNNFSLHLRSLTRINRNIGFIEFLPRAWLEFILILIVTLVILYLQFKGSNIIDYLPILGLYAAVTLRIMPSFSKILTALQRYKFGIAKIENLYNEFNLETEKNNTKNSNQNNIFKSEIIIKNLTFKYDAQIYNVLSDVDLTIKKNTKLGIIGKSGSGKSTFVDILLGLLKPTNGSIFIDGVDLRKNISGWQTNIGYVAQNIILTDDSLKKNIAFGLEEQFIDNNRIMESVKQANLYEFIKKLPEGLDTKVGEFGSKLSGGQLQRIGIARALYNNPEVLFLDEATSSLDKESENNIINTVMSLENKTIIIISHKYSSIKDCDIIVEVKNEKINVIDKNSIY